MKNDNSFANYTETGFNLWLFIKCVTQKICYYVIFFVRFTIFDTNIMRGFLIFIDFVDAINWSDFHLYILNVHMYINTSKYGRPETVISWLNFWDEAWGFLLLRVSGLLSWSLLLIPQHFSRYVFWSSSGILNACTWFWLTEWEQMTPVDSIKDIVWSSV